MKLPVVVIDGAWIEELDICADHYRIVRCRCLESPYAGQEAREIKSLSQQEIDSYLNGKGMGYARAAELNDYPGPLHVLELAKSLALIDEQLAKTQALYDRMKAQAAELGKALVGKERELDRQFAEGSIKADTLRELVAEIGALEAKIRYVHLEAHLEQRALLSGQQVRLYNRLRGYGAGRAHMGMIMTISVLV